MFYVQTWKSTGHVSPIEIKSQRSDGQVVTSSRARPSALISCPTCEDPYLLSKSKPESTIEIEPPKTKEALREFINSLDLHANCNQKEELLSWERLPEQLSQVPAYIPLTYRACLKVLNNSDKYEVKRFIYLNEAWHLFNDLRADDPSYEMKPEDKVILEFLLAETPRQHDSSYLRIAELYRELSRFDEAAAMLDRDFSFESGAEAEQLMQAIEAKNSGIFNFQLKDTSALSYAWQMRRFRPETPDEEETTSEIIPPVFKISNRDWWVKVLGMLQHNWALIEEYSSGTTTLYFFHDGGMTLGSSGYRFSEIRSRCAVVDSLDFPNKKAALQALKKNDFFRLAERPGPWTNAYPRGHFYDARATEEGIYSNGGYWI